MTGQCHGSGRSEGGVLCIGDTGFRAISHSVLESPSPVSENPKMTANHNRADCRNKAGIWRCSKGWWPCYRGSQGKVLKSFYREWTESSVTRRTLYYCLGEMDSRKFWRPLVALLGLRDALHKTEALWFHRKYGGAEIIRRCRSYMLTY